MSPEEKQRLSELSSKTMKAKVANGTHKGWQSRTKTKRSFPEQYIKSKFDEAGITVMQEVKCGKYFIDFVLGDKLALEVDGKQHQEVERSQKDAEKDALLTQEGWIILRLSWRHPRNPQNARDLLSQLLVWFQYYQIPYQDSAAWVQWLSQAPKLV